MARTIDREEREAATLVAVPDDAARTDDEDVQEAFEHWRQSFQQSDTPGEIRAFELQVDDRGVVGTTRQQVRLGSWPIDAYKFDELCDMIVRDYLDPEKSVMAVRLIGTRPGRTGFAFNKIVMLRRKNQQRAESSPGGSESTSDLLRAVQAMNDRNLALMRDLVATRQSDPTDELKKILTISAMLNKPMMDMMSQLLPALAGRPLPAAAGPSDPFSGLNGALDLVERLKDLRGEGGGSGEGDDNSLAGIIRALAPIAKPALEALPAVLSRMPIAAPAARPAIAPPAPGARPAAPGAAPTQPPPAAAAPPAASIADIPSGDAEVFAQLKPQIDSLVQMAEQGSDPSAAADMLFDQVILELPDEYYGKIVDIVTAPNFVSKAAVFNPKVRAHVEFFDKFRAQLEKRVTDEDAAAGQQPTG